jgi:hypothetical protein
MKVLYMVHRVRVMDWVKVEVVVMGMGSAPPPTVKSLRPPMGWVRQRVMARHWRRPMASVKVKDWNWVKHWHLVRPIGWVKQKPKDWGLVS